MRLRKHIGGPVKRARFEKVDKNKGGKLGVGLWENIKSKLTGTEKNNYDLRLKEVIKKMEGLPIYFSEHDFRGGNFTDIAALIQRPLADKEKLKEAAEKDRTMGNKHIARDKIWEIDHEFNPLLSEIRGVIANEPDQQKAEKLVEVYEKVRQVRDDYEKRVNAWQELGEQLISSEYHGTPITETFEKQLSRLYGLEEKYSVHNNDGGLKALKRAIDEIEKNIQPRVQDYYQGIENVRSEKGERESTREERDER